MNGALVTTLRKALDRRNAHLGHRVDSFGLHVLNVVKNRLKPLSVIASLLRFHNVVLISGA